MKRISPRKFAAEVARMPLVFDDPELLKRLGYKPPIAYMGKTIIIPKLKLFKLK